MGQPDGFGRPPRRPPRTAVRHRRDRSAAEPRRRFWPIALIAVVLSALTALAARTLLWLPPKKVGAVRALALLIGFNELVVIAALLGLLLTSDRWRPKLEERLSPRWVRWLWPLLMTLVVLSYASLAPIYLMALIKIQRR